MSRRWGAEGDGMETHKGGYLQSLYSVLVSSLVFWLMLACVETGSAIITAGFQQSPEAHSSSLLHHLRLFVAALSYYALLSIPCALALWVMEYVCSWFKRKTTALAGFGPMDYYLLLVWGLLLFKWISNLLPYLTHEDHLPTVPYLLIVPLLGLQLWLSSLFRGKRHYYRAQWMAVSLGAFFFSKTVYEVLIGTPRGVFTRLGFFIAALTGSLLAAVIFPYLLERISRRQLKPRARYALLFIMGLSGGLLVTSDALRIPGCVATAPSPPAGESEGAAGAVGKSAIVIVVDCLRPDHLGCYGYSRPISPSIDEISRSGIQFENCVAPSSWTIPSVVSLFTGLYPQQHAVNEPETVIPEQMVFLQEVLRGQGMNTAAFVTNDYLRNQWGYARGFNDYFDCYLERTFKEDLASRLFFLNGLIYFKNELLHPYSVDPGGARWWSVGFPPFNHQRISAERVTQDVCEWMKGHADAPFYLYVHFMDVHSPYDTVWYPLFDSTVYDSQDEKGKLINTFDGRIAYVDRQIGRIRDEVVRLGLSEKTLFIVTADHGEELYDHGGIGHCTTLYEELIKVPLLMVNPSLPQKGLRVERQVQLIDLPVTLCEFLGIKIPEQLEGESLVHLMVGSPSSSPAPCALSYTSRGRKSLETEEGRALWDKKVWDQGRILQSLRDDNGWKLIVGNDGVTELYNLGEDPEETKDLQDVEAARAKALHEKLREEVSHLKDYGSSREKQDLSPDAINRLKALGYL